MFLAAKLRGTWKYINVTENFARTIAGDYHSQDFQDLTPYSNPYLSRKQACLAQSSSLCLFLWQAQSLRQHGVSGTGMVTTATVKVLA